MIVNHRHHYHHHGIPCRGVHIIVPHASALKYSHERPYTIIRWSTLRRRKERKKGIWRWIPNNSLHLSSVTFYLRGFSSSSFLFWIVSLFFLFFSISVVIGKFYLPSLYALISLTYSHLRTNSCFIHYAHLIHNQSVVAVEYFNKRRVGLLSFSLLFI